MAYKAGGHTRFTKLLVRRQPFVIASCRQKSATLLRSRGSSEPAGGGRASRDSAGLDEQRPPAVRPRPRASAAIASLSAITTGSDGGWPKRVPFARIAVMPALSRSAMSSRSYSAKVASISISAGPSTSTGDVVRDRPGLHTALSQQVHRVQHVEQRTAKSVNSPHDDGVADGLLHPGPLDRGLAPRGDVREDVAPLHVGGDECVELQLRVLTRRTHTRIAQNPHDVILTRKYPPVPT